MCGDEIGRDVAMNFPRAAFSLAEVMVSSMIASVMMLGLTAMLYLPVRAMLMIDDAVASRDRAEAVFAILRKPVELCGYGMPHSPGNYRASFGIKREPFDWQGPISVHPSGKDAELKENRVCKIVYAERSRIRTTESASTSGDIVVLRTTGIPSKMGTDVSVGGYRYDTNNWILFGGMTPVCVPVSLYAPPRKLGNNSAVLPIKAYRYSPGAAAFHIPENDEIFYVRVLECSVMKGRDGDSVFATNDHSGASWQPRVDGVIDVRFELEGRLLRIFALTRGETRYEREVTPGAPPEWPERYAGDIPKWARHYALYADSAAFELKNY
jgi:hypothetical protein